MFNSIIYRPKEGGDFEKSKNVIKLGDQKISAPYQTYIFISIDYNLISTMKHDFCFLVRHK